MAEPQQELLSFRVQEEESVPLLTLQGLNPAVSCRLLSRLRYLAYLYYLLLLYL